MLRLAVRWTSRGGFLPALVLMWALAAARLDAAEPASDAAAGDRPPNFVVMFCDNLGYGAVGCFGSTLHRTPNLDRMAEEGTRFTSFYVTSGVCTPSRASLMTGCYPRRVSMHSTDPDGAVLRPVSPNGLHPDEITIAEALKQRGYATGIIGKWHLGDQPPFLPTRQGFDFWFGIPYSDDMVHTHPRGRERGWPPLPLVRNEKVIEAPADRDTLVRRCTEEAIEFIRRCRDEPFFVYVPHITPGSTQASFASRAFRGKSANGLYGDAVEELDWSLGEMLAALKELDLDERTLVIWTSDNGALRRDPPQGSNAPLRGWLGSTLEGAMRVPCVVRWPGKVPAGSVCDEIVTTMDLLPTFARLAGTTEPQDRIIDGRDVRPLLAGRPNARSPHEAFYYYDGPQLQAVRSGKWKLHLPLENKRRGVRDGGPSQAELYDLDADIGETTNVADRHPKVVRRLTALADKAREDLGDLDRDGKNQRPAGWVDHPQPLVMQQ
jgi:arylsulfatase A